MNHSFHIYLLSVICVLVFASCSSQKKLTRKAEAFFENGEYFKALEFYEKLLETETSKYNQAVYQYKAAECYRMLNNSRKAEVAYRKAIRQKSREKEAHYWHGYFLLKNEKYKEAQEAFTAYKKIQPKDPRAQNGIESCSLAVAWQENPTRYTVENIRQINSREHDFAPAYITNDFSTIYFTSSRTIEGVKQSVNLVSGMNYTDVFEARIDRKGTWTSPVKLQDTTINTNFDDGTVSLSPDKTTIYFTQCLQEIGKNIGCQIYKSNLRGGSWSAAERLDIVADSISVGHPSISADGLELYFASNMKGGYGGLDIWKVQRISESAPWSKPINLGALINTNGNEVFPYIRQDGNLYFSSDGHPGMGGLDIFRATKDDKGQWNILNMQHPINSSQDDFGIVFQGNKEIGLFTSNRRGGRGEDDIYSFELPELQILVNGKLLDASTKKPIAEGDITLIGSDGSLITAQTKKDGSYSFKLNQYTDYIVLGSTEGFLKKKITVSTNNIFDNTTFEKNIELITMSKPVEIPNIFYDFGKWTLNETSKQALEELGKLLQDNPNITIELGAHTDMVGDSTANLLLSKRRAQSVIEYLTQQGYDPERLVARGFGESRPVTVSEEIAKIDPAFTIGTVLSQDFILSLPKETQEKANQINRRTELKILSTDYIPKPEYFEQQKKRFSRN